MKKWALILRNYCGNDDVIYFENHSLAKESFERCCENHYNDDEFERNETSCSWFDSNYNEYSTDVFLDEVDLIIFDKVINNI